MADGLNETHQQLSFERVNLAVKVALVDRFTHAINIVGTISNKNVPSIDIKDNTSSAFVQSEIVIPVENLIGLDKPVVRVYNLRNSSLFLSDDSAKMLKSGENSATRFVGSNVLSASVNDQFRLLTDDHFSNLSEPVTVSFRKVVLKKTQEDACMFWNFSCSGKQITRVLSL